MKLTLQQRISRMQNLKSAAVANVTYGRRMYIRDYLPGFAVYEGSLEQDTATFERLKALAEAKVDVLLLPAREWKTEAAPKFTGLCHYFGLRVLWTVDHWEGAPDPQWRQKEMQSILQTTEECGFDGIVADMRQWEPQNSAAYDPQTEDMLWQLYTTVKGKGGLLVLRTRDGQEPPCIDQVYDYLQTDNAELMLRTQGFVLPEKADFAKTVPYLQLPLLTEDNEAAWKKYRALYAPMVQELTLAYLDLQTCADIASELTAGVHASMFVNDVKYLAVANLSDKPYALELAEQWTDRVTNKSAETYSVQPGQLLLLEK